jgi:hypothetical protein
LFIQSHNSVVGLPKSGKGVSVLLVGNPLSFANGGNGILVSAPNTISGDEYGYSKGEYSQPLSNATRVRATVLLTAVSPILKYHAVYACGHCTDGT